MAPPINTDAEGMLRRFEQAKEDYRMNMGVRLVILGGVIAIVSATLLALTATNVLRPAYNPNFINMSAFKSNAIVLGSLTGSTGLVIATVGAYNLRAVIIKNRQANMRHLSPSPD